MDKYLLRNVKEKYVAKLIIEYADLTYCIDCRYVTNHKYHKCDDDFCENGKYTNNDIQYVWCDCNKNICMDCVRKCYICKYKLYEFDNLDLKCESCDNMFCEYCNKSCFNISRNDDYRHGNTCDECSMLEYVKCKTCNEYFDSERTCHFNGTCNVCDEHFCNSCIERTFEKCKYCKTWYSYECSECECIICPDCTNNINNNNNINDSNDSINDSNDSINDNNDNINSNNNINDNNCNINDIDDIMNDIDDIINDIDDNINDN